MSPEPLPAVPPVRPTPSEMRCAMRRSWCGASGASVAAIAMIEPRPAGISAPPGPKFVPVLEALDLTADLHAGDRQLVAAAEVRLHQHADRVRGRAEARRGAMPCRFRT